MLRRMQIDCDTLLHVPEQDAQEIFGDVGGLLEQYENRRRGGGDGDADEDEDEFGEGAEGREEDEDAAEERHRLQVQRLCRLCLSSMLPTCGPGRVLWAASTACHRRREIMQP